MPNKVLFLDFDGVLNPYLYSNHLTKMWKYKPDIVKSRDQFGDYFAPWCVDELAHLVRFTGCELVISSTWRVYMDVKHMWEFRRLPGTVIGQTPQLLLERGLEVKAWCEENGTPDKFAIIDDIDEFTNAWGGDHFVQTVDKYGWTRKETERLIELLY
jgi:hypothetical protein